MIIQVRGTSGSGKSTVMRNVMGMTEWQGEIEGKRKKPLYYRSVSEWPSTAILGHYESPCGGCDTIGSAKAVYELTQILEKRFSIIIQEGLLLSEDVKWSSQMKDLKIVFLTTPLEQCLEWIEKRRKSVGNDKPLNPLNTSNRVKVIERARIKLVEIGAEVCRASANQAPQIVMNWIQQCKTK